MEGQPNVENHWSSTQAYMFAVICLAVGIGCGYLLRGSSKSTTVSAAPQQVSGQQPAQVAAMPSPDQMKHMGDKMAEPLLAQLQKDPKNPELYAKVGSVYFRAGQFPAAVENYEKSVKLKPTAEGYVSLSNSYHYAGEDDKAFASLDEALKLDPKSANALFNLGMLRWQVKNDPKGAIESWQRLLKTNPNHPKRAAVENMIAKAKQHMSMPAPDANKPKSEM